MSKMIEIDPDWLLEWLIERGYVEKTSSAFTPYRIATDTDTDRPYTITDITKSLKRSLNRPGRSGHNKPLCRELKKCFDEFNISYLSIHDHAQLCAEMKFSKIKEIEEKFGIDLDPLNADERRKIGVVYNRYLKKFGREDGLKAVYLYAQRRLQNLGKDLRNGRVRRYKAPRTESVASAEQLQREAERETESLASILANGTSGALFSNRPVVMI